MISRPHPEPLPIRKSGIPVALYNDYSEGQEYYDCLACGSMCGWGAFCASCGTRFSEFRDRVRNDERRRDLVKWAGQEPYFITKIIVLEVSRENDRWRWYHEDAACKKEMDADGSGPGVEWDPWRSIQAWDLETVGATTAHGQAAGEMDSFLRMHHDCFCTFDVGRGLWISTDPPERVEDAEPCGHGRVRFRLRVCKVLEAEETGDMLGLRVEYRTQPGAEMWMRTRWKSHEGLPGIPVSEEL
jgi:hypothetical protein